MSQKAVLRVTFLPEEPRYLQLLVASGCQKERFFADSLMFCRKIGSIFNRLLSIDGVNVSSELRRVAC